MFFELAELNRKFEVKLKQRQRECKQALEALGPKAPAERRDRVVLRLKEKGDELMAELEEKLIQIDRRYRPFPYNPLAYSFFTLNQPAPDTDRLFQYLHWLRHRESLQTTAASDAKGDIKAWRKLARTAEDLRRIVHKKGPIKRFQGDVVHRQLLELILCYEIKPLTAEERAECVDRYCACGKTHDADALKKQSARLKRELQACVIAPARPTTRPAPKIRK